MLHVTEVSGLLFDWGKKWRKGSEPAELEELFHAMVDGRDRDDLCEFIFKRIVCKARLNPHFGALQVAAIIASMLVIDAEIRANFLARLKTTLNENSDDQAIEFHQGCVLGLFKAVVMLEQLGASSSALENCVWDLAFTAAEKADFHMSQSHNLSDNCRGHLSNLIGEYTRINHDGRWRRMELCIVGFEASLLKKKGSLAAYSAHGTTRFLLNEISHKIFGWRVDDAARMNMVCAHLMQS